MAIASGIPIPQLYYLPKEICINAFACGSDINDSMICLTRGSIENLTRDELQGLIAHEFSHIFWGDIKLNSRLLSVLFGLTFLTHIGYQIIRFPNRSLSRNRKSDKAGEFLIGLTLIIVGSFGYFIGKIIVSLISKEREYLADASAVRFTRNPEGIGGTLKKILASKNHFLISANSYEFSHFYFYESLKSNLFSTHPPLLKRIKKILPKFNIHQFKRKELDTIIKQLNSKTEIIVQDNIETRSKNSREWNKPQNLAYISNFESAIGPKSIAQSRSLLNNSRSFMDQIVLSTEESIKFVIIYFCQLSKINHPRLKLCLPKHQISRSDFDKIDNFLNKNLEHKNYMHIEQVIPTLQTMPKTKITSFLKELKKLILADNKTHFIEYCAYKSIKHELLKPNSKKSNLSIKESLQCLFSIFYQLTPNHEQSHQYSKSTAQFKIKTKMTEISKISYQKINQSLANLNKLSYQKKQTVLEQMLINLKNTNTHTYQLFFVILVSKVLNIPTPIQLYDL
jgi:hypothetical protein